MCSSGLVVPVVGINSICINLMFSIKYKVLLSGTVMKKGITVLEETGRFDIAHVTVETSWAQVELLCTTVEMES